MMLNSLAQRCVFALAALASFAAYGAERDMIFGIKVFYERIGKTAPDMIYVTGTLTGKGVIYKNNTTAVTCYSDTKECLTYSIEQIGDNQLSRLRPPDAFPIVKWDKDEVVAAGSWDLRECSKVTISISRKTQAAIWVIEPINRYRAECEGSDTELKLWSIEDPPFWKKAKAVHKK